MITKYHITKFFVLISLLFCAFAVVAQEDDEEYWGRLLQEEVEVENPVYKPVLSIGSGLLNFMGDVKNPGNNPLTGEFGFKFNLSTYMGRKNFYKLNFFLMYGNLQGHDFSISRAMQSDPDLFPIDDSYVIPRTLFHNSSFRTEFFLLGANAEYGFAHLIGLSRKFRPYFSIGVSSMIFNPKGNIYRGDETLDTYGFYHFWSDGTIRSFAENHPNNWTANIVGFDKTFETDLVSRDLHDVGRYPTTTAAFPAEVGFDLYLSYRVYLRVSATYFYTLSDFIDNYNQKVAERYETKHDGYNDGFLFTNFSLHFDLFSDPKYIRIDKVMAELDYFDYDVIFADEDGDGVYDRFDDCPDTPIGAQVDSLGCPYDFDFDGIPDYLDKEQDTPSGSVVDDDGVQLSPDKLVEMYELGEAVKREEVKVVPVMPIWTRSIVFTPGEVPQKFRLVDKDVDGYVSFQELMWAIEDFFDQKSSYSLEDIYELNNFFFSQ